MTLRQHFIPASLFPLLIALSLLDSACQKTSPIAKLSDPASVAPASFITPPLHLLAWQQQPNLPITDGIPGVPPTGLEGPLAFTINGKGYICGGGTVDSQLNTIFLNELWEYDTATKAWTQRATFPGPNQDGGTCFVIGNDAYVQVANTLWQYDQPTDLWTQKAGMPTVPRAYASSFALAGMGYIGFGYALSDSSGDLGDFWQYNPSSNTWLEKPGFPAAKRDASASFVINNNGYVATGETWTGSSRTYLTDLWEYVPALSKWVRKANFPATGRTLSVGLSANGYGYVATGDSNDGWVNFNDCWEYDDNSGQWFGMPNVGGPPRFAAGGFSIGSNLYIAGGGPGNNEYCLLDFWKLALN